MHGFAASIGGYFPIAHGVICSSLMPATNRVTVRKLRSQRSNDNALAKYAIIGKLFAVVVDNSPEYYVDLLLDTIENWTVEMNIPRLGQGGVTSSDFMKIVSATDNKNNPVALNEEEMVEILEMAV